MDGQHINCNVKNCKYNNQARACSLGDIMVGSSSAAPHAKRDTECASFEMK